VFVYGTLTEPSTAERILDRYESDGPAVVRGLHRVEGEYPTLAPGGHCEERLLSTGPTSPSPLRSPAISFPADSAHPIWYRRL